MRPRVPQLHQSGATDKQAILFDASTGLWRPGDVLTSPAELLMQDGVSAPPVPIETEDRTDWLYKG